MNIYIETKKNNYNLDLKQFNIIYTNENIQYLSDIIINSFDGKEFMEINKQAYKKTNYNIINIDKDFNIKDTEKFNSKSIEYKALTKKVSLTTFEDKMQEFTQNVMNLFQTYQPHLELKLKKASTLDLVSTLFKISLHDQNIDPDIFRLMLILDICQSTSTPSFVIFENTFLDNNNKFNKLQKYLASINIKNTYFIFLTNSIQVLSNISTLYIYEENNINKLNIMSKFKQSLIIYKLQKNQNEVVDFYTYYTEQEIEKYFEKYITLSSWYNYWNNQKKLSIMEQIFFTLLFDNSIIQDQQYKELLWVEEQ